MTETDSNMVEHRTCGQCWHYCKVIGKPLGVCDWLQKQGPIPLAYRYHTTPFVGHNDLADECKIFIAHPRPPKE